MRGNRKQVNLGGHLDGKNYFILNFSFPSYKMK